jgi:hypothetical protein
MARGAATLSRNAASWRRHGYGSRYRTIFSAADIRAFAERYGDGVTFVDFWRRPRCRHCGSSDVSPIADTYRPETAPKQAGRNRIDLSHSHRRATISRRGRSTRKIKRQPRTRNFRNDSDRFGSDSPGSFSLDGLTRSRSTRQPPAIADTQKPFPHMTCRKHLH